MFSIGQMVYHRSRALSGKVLECDGDTVYLTQDNGVEIEFRSSDLSATPPKGRSGFTVASAATAIPSHLPNAAVPSRVLTSSDITAEHRKVLSVIPPRTLQSVTALFEKRPKAGRFSALDVAQKINYIAEITSVPYRTMKEFSDRPSELGLMMARGLAVSSGTAR